MKTIYIEKSCGPARDGAWTAELDLAGAGRIVVGTGPGSFAGVRAAIAFATGWSVGSGCEVLGLPSPCAVAGAADSFPLAVVGDARKGMRWLALFDGGESGAPEVRLLSEPELKAFVAWRDAQKTRTETKEVTAAQEAPAAVTVQQG